MKRITFYLPNGTTDLFTVGAAGGGGTVRKITISAPEDGNDWARIDFSTGRTVMYSSIPYIFEESEDG